eukprot:2198328-Prymnesium_polylepis.1
MSLSALLAERAQLAATLGVSVSDDVFLIDDVVAEVARLRQRVRDTSVGLGVATPPTLAQSSAAADAEEELMRLAKAAERTFTYQQQQSRPQDLLTNEELRSALDAVRAAFTR